MKVSKWVDFGQDVEVDIDASDIRAALSEAFSNITQDRLGEAGPDRRDVAHTLNSIATFLNGVADEHIALLTDAQRKTISQYFAKAAERFAVQEATRGRQAH